jgi:phosphotransferase system  glucose/maltose/N-acetylglucosamine-specific IIC component
MTSGASDTTYILVTLGLAAIVFVLFKYSSRSKALQDEKRAEVERKRAAMRAKRRAEAKAEAEKD